MRIVKNNSVLWCQHETSRNVRQSRSRGRNVDVSMILNLSIQDHSGSPSTRDSTVCDCPSFMSVSVKGITLSFSKPQFYQFSGIKVRGECRIIIDKCRNVQYLCGHLCNAPDGTSIHQVYGPRGARGTKWTEIFFRCFPDILVVRLCVNFVFSIL